MVPPYFGFLVASYWKYANGRGLAQSYGLV